MNSSWEIIVTWCFLAKQTYWFDKKICYTFIYQSFTNCHSTKFENIWIENECDTEQSKCEISISEYYSIAYCDYPKQSFM